MRKYKKGINLVALVCVIFVLIILAGTIVVSFNNIYISTKKKEFANEIYNVQKLVDQYYFKNGEYPVKGNDIYFDLSLVDDVKTEFIPTKEVDLYEAGVEESNRGQKNISEDDIYIVSNSGVIYYKLGQKIGDETYYTLTDDLKKHLGLVK